MNKPTSNDAKARIVYFSHGGGPLPILGDASHRAMVSFMEKLPSQLERPDAIVVISAHWEENFPTIQSIAAPSIIYDYYGFPEAAYEVKYPAKGNPELARKISQVLNDAGIPSRQDPQREFDHGLYIPLKMMYPEADIPSIQLSLIKGLDAGLHIRVGEVLRGLDGMKILVIGSGFSFHNMSAFFPPNDMMNDAANNAFQDWLIETCAGSLSWDETVSRLQNWESAPSARYCHPREEHLLPLHVCAGMAGRPGKVIFDDYIAGKRGIAVLWA